MINTSDPLALLAIEAGQVINPSRQEGAAGAGRLDVAQRSIDFGESVPIVFGLRREDKGGILISPGAAECRFENDETNAVTAYYLLVLSEGRLGPIPVKDVFQKSCRVGDFTQTYNRRAGSWLPGNFIVQREDLPLPEATFICGSIGLYPDITTVSFQITIPNGFRQWDRQVHFFIREGMYVDQFLTSDQGPSDNFADLIYWMLVKANRIPLPLIDTEQLASTALFLEANGLTCNCWIQNAKNYTDFISSWGPYFLLIASNRGGKKGLRPILPVNNDGTIKIDSVAIEYTFSEDLIIPETFTIDYSSYADRQPFVAQMTWRQELGDEAAIIRTSEIRITGTAEVGPYESYDLSEFCTSENHAVKVGAYIVADRLFTTHSIKFSPRPGLHSTLLSVGSIIRVVLTRQTEGAQPFKHDYLYQIQRISQTFYGEVQYECRHFPIDDQRRSIVALNVANAFGTGILLTSATTGVSCDINSSTDNTFPIEEFVIPNFETGFDDIFIDGIVVDQFNDADFGTGIAVGGDLTGIDNFSGIGEFGDIGSGFGGFGSFGAGGAGDGLGELETNPLDFGDATPLGPFPTEPVPGGDPVDGPEGICEDPIITRTLGNISDPNNPIFIQETVDNFSFPITPPDELGLDDWNFSSISFSISCPNGEKQYIDPIFEPQFDPTQYLYWRVPGGDWYSTATTQPVGVSFACNPAAPTLVLTPCGDVGSWIDGFEFAVYSTEESDACANGSIRIEARDLSTNATIATVVSVSVNGCNGVVGEISTSYEFSNDQSTVAATWAGFAGPEPELPDFLQP